MEEEEEDEIFANIRSKSLKGSVPSESFTFLLCYEIKLSPPLPSTDLGDNFLREFYRSISWKLPTGSDELMMESAPTTFEDHNRKYCCLMGLWGFGGVKSLASMSFPFVHYLFLYSAEDPDEDEILSMDQCNRNGIQQIPLVHWNPSPARRWQLLASETSSAATNLTRLLQNFRCIFLQKMATIDRELH